MQIVYKFDALANFIDYMYKLDALANFIDYMSFTFWWSFSKLNHNLYCIQETLAYFLRKEYINIHKYLHSAWHEQKSNEKNE